MRLYPRQCASEYTTNFVLKLLTMAEIKIRDLSIGDWVRYRDREWQVCSLYQFTGEVGLWRKDSQFCEYVSDLSPIPLTPEILEKNGFERGEYSEIRVYNEWEIGEWSNPPYVSVRLDIDRQVIRVTNRGRDMFIADKEVYVHQLQHALRLAGVGKEIEV